VQEATIKVFINNNIEFPPTTQKDKRTLQAVETIKYYVWYLSLMNYVCRSLPNKVTINYYWL